MLVSDRMVVLSSKDSGPSKRGSGGPEVEVEVGVGVRVGVGTR